MANIKFKYLYRDGSNFKNWCEVVFSNSAGLPPVSVADALRSYFTPDGYFIASQVNVPEVFLFDEHQLNPDDHCFHEFDSVEATDHSPTDKYGRSIAEFIREVENEAESGWEVWDPLAPFEEELRHSFKRFLSVLESCE